jgi:hypothetical protein
VRPKRKMSGSVESETSGLSLHGLMSQGLNVVIAKRLMNIDSRYDQQIFRLEEKWQARLDQMEAMLHHQHQQLEGVKVELKVTKLALKAARGESTAWKRQAQQVCSTLQSQSEALLKETKEVQSGSESCRAQVETTLTLLKKEFEAIVDHIGKHDASMAAAKTEMERRLHGMTETTRQVHTGFLAQQMEMMSLRNAVRGLDGQTRDIAPCDQGQSITMDQSIDLVNASDDKLQNTHDVKECISILSIDSYESLRLELERKFQDGSETMETVVHHNGSRPSYERGMQVQGVGVASHLVETPSEQDGDMSIRIVQAKNKLQSFKERGAMRTDDVSVVSADTYEAKANETCNTNGREGNRTSVDPAASENVRNRFMFEEQILEQLSAPTECEHVMESDVVVITSSEKQRPGKRVTFVTENEEGDDELEYLVFMGEREIGT